MKGIWFDNTHSYNDLNLILSSVSIPPAAVKTNYIDIPGADGSLDMTEALGAVRYKDRSCSFVFSVFPYEDFEEKKKQISNLLNGRRCKIKLDKDSEYYWVGRCSVNNYASDRNLHKITVNATVNPYKYKVSETAVFVPFCGKNLLDVSEANQLNQVYGSVEYISNGVRKSGTYFVGFSAFVNPNTTYYMSLNVKKITAASTPGNGGRIAIYDKGVKNIITSYPSSEGNVVFSFNSGKHTEISVLFYSDSDKAQGVYEFTNIQLEDKRSTAFEAFTPIETKEITLTNGRKVVCPSITCSNDNTVFTVGELEFTLSKGTHKVLDFQLQEGATTMSINGTGAVHINYQEGDL